MVVQTWLSEDETRYLVKVLAEELRRLRRKLASLEKELHGLEERYGMGTEEFIEMYSRAKRGEAVWRLPEEADMDSVEWLGLALLRREVEEEIERLEKILAKIRTSREK